MARVYAFDDTNKNKNCGDYLVLVDNKRRTNVMGERREKKKAQEDTKNSQPPHNI